LFDSPSEPGDLQFRKGDVITLLEPVVKDWWKGSLRGNTGIVPLNYVEVLQNLVAEEPPQQQHTPYYPPGPAQSAPNSYATRTHEKRHPLRTLKGDVLSAVFIQDGDDPKSFDNAETLSRYTMMFPEAENDQGCRLFMYGPKCPTNLLMALFEHFDFPRYSLFPYGLLNDFAKTNKPHAGSCQCQRCEKGEDCGHWALHRNLQFYLQQDIVPSSTKQPKVDATSDAIIISSGGEYVACLSLSQVYALTKLQRGEVPHGGLEPADIPLPLSAC
jgi:hypothetical protein